MTDQDQLIVNRIVEFLYVDNVAFQVNRESRYQIMSMGCCNKQTLVENHKIRGFFVAAGLNANFLAKILKLQKQDVSLQLLADHELILYDNINAHHDDNDNINDHYMDINDCTPTTGKNHFLTQQHGNKQF